MKVLLGFTPLGKGLYIYIYIYWSGKIYICVAIQISVTYIYNVVKYLVFENILGEKNTSLT